MPGRAIRENVCRLQLEGAVNFRDLGGYQTSDGRQLKWGFLFRSDSLAALSDADIATIGTLQLRSIFDLRHEDERLHRPSRIGQDWGARVYAGGFYPQGAETLMQRVRDRLISRDEAKDALLEMYRQLPLAHAPYYAKLLEALARPDALPALIHCTSGKDRTGFALAVVLMALGVTRQTILEDYVLTNQYRRDLSFMLGTGVDPEVLEMVTSARPEFLSAAFAVIDEVWGGDQHFIRDGLGFSAQRQQFLKARLLDSETPAAASKRELKGEHKC